MKTLNKNEIPRYGVVWRTLLVTVVLFAISLTTVNAQDCEPTYSYGCNSGDGIDSVYLEGDDGALDDSNIGCEGNLQDKTDEMSVTLTPGEIYEIEVSTISAYSNWAAVFIDVGHNFVLVGSSDTISGTTGEIPPFTLNIPADIGGEGVLRVMTSYSFTGEPIWDACGSYNYGSAVDYAVNLGDLDACSNANAGLSMDDFSICEGVTFTLETDGASSTQDGLSYQWEQSEDSNNWIDIDNANSKTYTVGDGIDKDMYYRLKVTCEYGGEDTSAIIKVSLNSINECYCEAVSSTVEPITYVGFGDIDNTTDFISNEGYEDFTEQSTQVISTETYEITLKGNTGWNSTSYFIVFIDWNQNGILDDPGEVYPIGTIYNSTGTGEEFIKGNIEVPQDVVPGNTRMRIRKNLGSSSLIDPCGPNSLGQVEDYTVQVVAFEACASPYAGVAMDDFSICERVAFTLETEGASSYEFGLSYQWEQSEDNNNWTNIDDADSKTYTVEDGVDSQMFYRLKVTCENGGEDISDLIGVSLNPGNECYCEPSYLYSCSGGIVITNITLIGETESINNDSACSDNDYGDYTSLPPANLVPGLTYTLSVSTDNYSSTSEQVRAWIDYNDDGEFSEDEMIAETDGTGLLEGTGTFDFTVPINEVVPGYYRMRVRLVWGSSPPIFGPCDDMDIGETEDYTVQVGFLEDCANPYAGVAMDDFSICEGVAFTLETDDVSSGEYGLSYQWEQSEDNISWTDIDGADSKTYTVVDGIDSEMFYRLKVTCENGGEDSSDIIEVSLNPVNECHCKPSYRYGCNSGDRISNVTLSGETKTINNDSACSDDDYGDYTGLPAADLEPGESYTLSVSTDHVFPIDIETRVWIDYNDDGEFSEDEIIAQTDGTGLLGGTRTFDFIVPGVAPGNYKMRIRVIYGSEAAPVFGPCEIKSYGETEDYTIQVLALDACANADAGVAMDGFSICEGVAFTLETENVSSSENGLYYQWEQSEDNNNWTDIDGANFKTYTVEDGIDNDMYYRLNVTCENGGEDTSDIIAVELNTILGECYCQPNGVKIGQYINYFSATGDGNQEINNQDSGFSDGTYGDFTNMIVSAEANSEINFEATIVGGFAGILIWVDWNNDGSFDTEEELVYHSPTYSVIHNDSFQVPYYASGAYRMRIVSYSNIYWSDIDPCQAGFTPGEFEDYGIEVTPLEDCSTPDAGTLVTEDMNVCAGTAFTLDVEGDSDSANGLIRQWMFSVDGGTEWSAIDGATSSAYNVSDGILEETQFKYVVSCVHDNSNDESDVVTIGLIPFNECYCEPETGSSYWISSFLTTGGEQNIDNEVDAPTNGYQDFTDQVVSQKLTESVDFEAAMQGTSSAGLKIWVDWNQDGSFNENEIAYSSSGYGTSFGGTINVPEDAEEGEIRMRLGISYYPGEGPQDPCGNVSTPSYVSYQDYTFDVLPAPTCPAPSDLAVNNITAESAEISWTTDADQSDVYYIQSGAGDPDEFSTPTHSGVTSPITLNGLYSNENYEVYVRADCGDGVSDWVGPVEFTVPEEEPCDAPTAVIVSNITEDSAHIEWNGNADEYEVHYTDGVEDNTMMTSDNFVNLVGLDADTEYIVSVISYCEEEASEESENVEFTTLEEECELNVSGEIYFTGGSDIVVCVEDPHTIGLGVDASLGEEFTWVITDENGDIVELLDGFQEDWVVHIDFDSYDVGNYEVDVITWNEGGIEGLEVGNNVEAISGDCYEWLESPVEVSVEICEEPCENPEVAVSVVDEDEEAMDCVEENGQYYVLLELTGGSGNSSYTVYDDSDNTLETDLTSDGTYLAGPYDEGNSVSFTVQGNDDDDCSVTTDAIDPDVCVDEPTPCENPEVSISVVDADEEAMDCVEEAGQYYVLLELTGGAGNSSYTVYDNSDNALATDLTSGGTYLAGPYDEGNSVSFTVEGNDDVDCSVTTDTVDPDVCGDEPSLCDDPYNENADGSEVYISTIEMAGIGVDEGNSDYDLQYTSNSMSTDGYDVITNPIITIYPGLESAYTVSSGPAGNDNQYYYAVWVDFNQDGCFDAGEQIIWSNDAIWGGGIPNGEEGVVDVPYAFGEMAPGTYQARIRNSMVAHPMADGNGDGEALDFTIDVITEAEAEYILGVNNQVFTEFTYYPSPVQNQLTLQAGVPIEQVEVYNLLGQKVIQVKPNTLEVQLDTDRLLSAVYLMKVTIDGNQKTFRVVKK